MNVLPSSLCRVTVLLDGEGPTSRMRSEVLSRRDWWCLPCKLLNWCGDYSQRTAGRSSDRAGPQRRCEVCTRRAPQWSMSRAHKIPWIHNVDCHGCDEAAWPVLLRPASARQQVGLRRRDQSLAIGVIVRQASRALALARPCSSTTAFATVNDHGVVRTPIFLTGAGWWLDACVIIGFSLRFSANRSEGQERLSGRGWHPLDPAFVSRCRSARRKAALACRQSPPFLSSQELGPDSVAWLPVGPNRRPSPAGDSAASCPLPGQVAVGPMDRRERRSPLTEAE